jgi:sulfate transport system ATP-binding protein
MRFLGDVNELPVASTGGAGSVGYVRPHEVDISRSLPISPAFEARVRRLQTAGSSVRVEADIESLGKPIVAEIDERRFEELALHCGETVFVSARRLRVFDLP